MPTILTKKIPKHIETANDILSSFCYHFQQYTLIEAEKLPYKRVRQMLKAVRREKAKDFIQLTKIVASPNTKGGSGVKNLLEYYEGIIKE